MNEIFGVSRTIWLRTDRPVVPMNTVHWHHLLAVQNALQQGVFATTDAKRPEFYELEVEDRWYYIHVPSRIAGVYLIAVGRKPCEVPIGEERGSESFSLWEKVAAQSASPTGQSLKRRAG